eukprot:TRINITY_DN1526_c0_g1_i1.p1 TRINITY_DN1526_c0_g1~~TRINITY_DN1526_c0_g1_i1.p1  ORF type:complete len:452 (+),score=100.46 TRINITY_DN1526_c0_g1_i1:128-1483(+)
MVELKMRLLLTLAIAAIAAADSILDWPYDLQAATDAYIYAYPPVLAEYTRRVQLESGSKMNQFRHMQHVPSPTDHQLIVRPNADTLYSSAWLNLTEEPLVLSVPKIGRYYILEFMDAYTNVFSDPGIRVVGTDEPRQYLITGPGFNGTVPSAMYQISSPTDLVWIMGRIRVTGTDEDYAEVHAVQAKFSLVPFSSSTSGLLLSQFSESRSGFVPGAPDIIKNLTIQEFYGNLTEYMCAYPPPADQDAEILQKLAHFGIVPCQKFEPTADQVAWLEKGRSLYSLSAVAQLAGKIHLVNWWSYLTKDIGAFGSDYAARAYIGQIGLAANIPQDAVYMKTVSDLQGDKYTMRFEKGQLPPVDGFWSITLYTPEGYFFVNDAKKYAVRDADPLRFDSDGSLTIYIQSQAPSVDLLPNWLPCPADSPWNLLIRLYSPHPEVLSFKWQPPMPMRHWF